MNAAATARIRIVTDHAIAEHTARMARIAVAHNTGRITDAMRDTLVEGSWNRAVAFAAKRDVQL